MDRKHPEQDPTAEELAIQETLPDQLVSGDLSLLDLQAGARTEVEVPAVDPPSSEESYDPFDDASAPSPPAFKSAGESSRRRLRSMEDGSEESALFEAELERIRTELMGLDSWKGEAELDDAVARGLPIALGGKADDEIFARAERWSEVSKRLMFLGFVASIAASLFPWMEPRLGGGRPPIATFGDLAFFLPLGLSTVAAFAWALGRPLAAACVALGWGSFALIGSAQFLFAITLVESTSHPGLARLLALAPSPGLGLWFELAGGALLVWSGALLSGSLLPRDRATLNYSASSRVGLGLAAATQGLGLGLALGWASFASLPVDGGSGSARPLPDLAPRPGGGAATVARPSVATATPEAAPSAIPTVALGQTIRTGGLAFTPLRVERGKVHGFQAGASFETEGPVLALRAKLRNTTEGEFFIPSPPRLLGWSYCEDQFGNRTKAIAPDPITREPVFDGQFSGELPPGEEVDAIFLCEPPRLDSAVNHVWTLAFVASARDTFDPASPPPSRTVRVSFTKFHIAEGPVAAETPAAATPPASFPRVASATPRPTPRATPRPGRDDPLSFQVKERAWLETSTGDYVLLPAGATVLVERTESIAGRALYFGSATDERGEPLGRGWLRDSPPPEPPKFATPEEAWRAEHLAHGLPAQLDSEVEARSKLIVREAYALYFDEELNVPLWTACRLDQEDIFSRVEISGRRTFLQDDEVDVRLAPPTSYRATGYELAPLVPPENARKSFDALGSTFYLTNFAPQRLELRRGPWSNLNAQAREWTRQRRQVWVYAGVAFEPKKEIERANNVAIPDYYWMALVDEKPGGALAAIGFLMPNAAEGLSSFYDYRASIESIERLAGVDLFPNLPPDVAADLRATTLVEWETR